MIVFLIIGFFAVNVLWKWYYQNHWAQNITVELWFETDSVYAGQDTKLYEVIENRKKMPVPVLEVGFHTQRELDFAQMDNTNVSDYIYKRDIFSVLGNQKITREIPVKCTKRGKYTVSDADIATHTLLYEKRYSKAIGTCAGIYVYPKMTDVSEIMTVCERLSGTLQCSKRLYEDPFEFRTIRAYTTDDPMKAVNWKASAKTGSLMVNTFDSVQSQKAMLFLDVEDTGILKYEDLVEESIAIAATLLRKLLRKNMEAGFAWNGFICSETNNPETGSVQLPSNKRSMLAGVERMLAEYKKENEVQDFSEFIERLFLDVFSKNPLTDDTLLIIITKNLNVQLMEQIKKCVGDYQTLVVVPALRGDKAGFAFAAKHTDTLHVLVKEVERS